MSGYFDKVGDLRALRDLPDEHLIIELESGEKRDIKSEDIDYFTVQLGQDIPPWVLRKTVLEFSRSGGGIVDLDPYDAIFQQPFREAESKTFDQRPQWAHVHARRRNQIEKPPTGGTRRLCPS